MMVTREDIERTVLEMHNAHYTQENPHGLLQPDEAPNTNTIYKVWNDGEITYEKGGYAFGDRSLKQLRTSITHTGSLPLPNFPQACSKNGYSYAMLTMDECYRVHALLKEYFDPFLPKRFEVRLIAAANNASTIDMAIYKLKMCDIRLVYRSPANDMFVVQCCCLLGTTAEEVEALIRSTLPDETFMFTRVDY
jgi:hypothetical protein